MNEMKQYSKKLVQKKIIITISKADLADAEEIKKIKKIKFKGINEKPLIISSVTGSGINEMLDYLWQILEKETE
jgi:GTP-binding protein